MPSGSHGGGGGGSHFGGGGGGGSHFGGGGHFGGSYYHGPRRPGRAPIHFHFFYFGGRRYSVANDDRSNIFGMIFACIVCLIIAIAWIFGITSSNQAVKKIENDYVYYQDMIAYAEDHPDHIIEANVQTFYENENCGKYYVTYYFYTASSQRVDGYTFSIYTFEQAREIKHNGTIQLAVDEYPLTTQTDSINMDFKNLPLSEDGEYIVAKNQIKTIVIIEAVLIGVFVLLVVLTIRAIKTNVEKVPEGEQPKMSKKYICTYCGAKLREEDTTCPKCGSSTIDTIVEKENK